MKKIFLLFITVQLSILLFGQNQTILNVNVNDMLYDKTRNKIFAVISSLDTQYGNTLIQIDCNTKNIENSLFVGSDPALIDITSDNNFLYVALLGSPKIIRVDIETFQIDLQFPIGPIDNYVDVHAIVFKTIPDNSNLIAVSREGNYNHDVVIFDNGVLLPDSFGIYYVEITEVETDSTGSILYGVDGNTLMRFEITPTGLTYIDEYDGVFSGGGILKMDYLNGLLYTNKGDVVNPHMAIPFIEGTFIGIENDSEMAINSIDKEIYFGIFDYSESFSVRNYNIETYTYKETKNIIINFPETMYFPELDEFICYGDEKFVISAYESYFPDDNEKFIIFIDSLYSGSSITNTDLQNNISVLPNPANDFINVKLPFIKDSQIKIINSYGMVIYAKKHTLSDVKIDLSGFNDGIYFIQIINNKKRIIKKIIKSNK